MQMKDTEVTDSGQTSWNQGTELVNSGQDSMAITKQADNFVIS